MATLRAYANGLTMHVGGSGTHTRAKRGEVVGWSRAAVRRHTAWLYAVDAPALDGHGWAVTLTLRDCPPDAAEWQRLRESWLQRVRRADALRWHWVVEWQRRGVPHLHAAVYVPGGESAEGVALLRSWIDAAGLYGAGWGSQTAQRIDGPVGWLQYLSKHAARGVQHYQRQGKPEGWSKTGRLWGYGGEWPTLEPLEVPMTVETFHRYRRLVRGWRVADARAGLARARTPDEVRAARRRIVHARHMLRTADPGLSRYRGVSEWIPEPLALRLLEAAVAVDGSRRAGAPLAG